MDDDDLAPAVAGWIGMAVSEAEDRDAEARERGDSFPTPYVVDAEDVAVWPPAKYLGTLLTISRLSKTARAAMRKFDRLPAADRRAMLLERLQRNHGRTAKSGVFATCPNCGAHRKIGDQRIHGLVYDPSVPCPKCGHMGSPPRHPCP